MSVAVLSRVAQNWSWTSQITVKKISIYHLLQQRFSKKRFYFNCKYLHFHSTESKSDGSPSFQLRMLEVWFKYLEISNNMCHQAKNTDFEKLRNKRRYKAGGWGFQVESQKNINEEKLFLWKFRIVSRSFEYTTVFFSKSCLIQKALIIWPELWFLSSERRHSQQIKWKRSPHYRR